jgi:hypothetical protein
MEGNLMPHFLNESFKASINKSPSLSAPTLVVNGDVQVPSSGWTVSLLRKEPQGFNPAILLLELRAEQPYRVIDQIMQRVPVRYEETPPKEDYKQVTIFEGQDSMTIDVAITQ